jgi:hypothetical protein
MNNAVSLLCMRRGPGINTGALCALDRVHGCLSAANASAPEWIDPLG